MTCSDINLMLHIIIIITVQNCKKHFHSPDSMCLKRVRSKVCVYFLIFLDFLKALYLVWPIKEKE